MATANNSNGYEIEKRNATETDSSTKQKIDHETRRQDIIAGAGTAEFGSIRTTAIMSPEARIPPLREGSGGLRMEVVAGGMPEPRDCLQSLGDGVTLAATAVRSAAGGDAIRDRNVGVDDSNVVGEMGTGELVDGEIDSAILQEATDAVTSMAPVIASTRADYRRKAALLINRYRDETGSPENRWALTFSAYAPTSSSFYAMRAAMAWCLQMRLKEVMSSGSTESKWEQGMGIASDCQHLQTSIHMLHQQLQIVQGIRRADLLEQFRLVAKRKTSKRTDLANLPDGWRRRLIEDAGGSRRYALAVEVLALTGCRPEELRKGVTLVRNGALVEIFISGAKVRSRCGQAWREVSVPLSALSRELQRALRKDGSKVRAAIGSTGGLRDHLRRKSRSAWPLGCVVTPYHFRHALAEDLRQDGWESHEIAEVLGQRSAKTTRHYGRKLRRCRGGPSRTALVRGRVTVTKSVPTLPSFSLARLQLGATRQSSQRRSTAAISRR